jgi:hypothetical protein
MFDVDFKLKNETDFTIKVFTMIEGEYGPAVMVLKPNEEVLHFKPSIPFGEISISVMAERSAEIERLREQAHYHYENGLKKNVEIERLRDERDKLKEELRSLIALADLQQKDSE